MSSHLEKSIALADRRYYTCRTQLAGATVSSAGKQFAPGRLWSLLDIMREIDVNLLFLNSQMLASLLAYADKHDLSHKVQPQPTVLPHLETIAENLEKCGLKVSLNIIKSNISYLKADPLFMHFGALKGQVIALQEAIYAELGTVTFFRVNDEYATYFGGMALFGKEVAVAFPTASLDIEEAGKCLALGRPTAAVFHLMRVMETGLRLLAKELKIDYAPSWESYIVKIETNITAKHKSKSTKWKAIEPFYKEILGNLMSIKIAWRNPTMHIERNYTPQEAEDIFRAVRTFMQRLSKKLSQA